MVKLTKAVSHPYYPVEAEITGYLANEYGVPTLLAAFAAGCATIFGVTYVLVTRTRRDISTSELLTVLWFTLCGFIHFFFEGYYVYNFRAMGGLQDIFGQL
jgi:cholestenol Delta-isomerase